MEKAKKDFRKFETEAGTAYSWAMSTANVKDLIKKLSKDNKTIESLVFEIGVEMLAREHAKEQDKLVKEEVAEEGYIEKVRGLQKPKKVWHMLEEQCEVDWLEALPDADLRNLIVDLGDEDEAFENAVFNLGVKALLKYRRKAFDM